MGNQRTLGPAGSLALILLAATSVNASPRTVTIRPQHVFAATHVDNPAFATDDNDATFAGMSLKRVCRDDHEQPWRGTLVVDRFAAGFRPIRLEVTWTAQAVFAVMQDNRASVAATVEYATGETWHRVDSATWSSSSRNCPVMPDGSLTCLNHSAGVDLPPGLDSARLRVRVTLVGGFSECQANGMSGVANIAANAQIYDVRAIAQKAARPKKP